MSTIGKVYKIYSEQTDRVYIGSTTKLLLQRFLQHKTNYRRYNDGTYNFVTSFHILQYDDANIELIEEVEFDDKKELIRRERFHIEQNECVNKRVEGRTSKEWGQDNKDRVLEHKQKYREKNREKLLEKAKENYQENREKRLEQAKQYREQNKKMISEKNKKWYQSNKEKLLDKLKVKISCDCGSVVRKSDIKRHERSKKHQKYLETIV